MDFNTFLAALMSLVVNLLVEMLFFFACFTNYFEIYRFYTGQEIQKTGCYIYPNNDSIVDSTVSETDSR